MELIIHLSMEFDDNIYVPARVFGANIFHGNACFIQNTNSATEHCK